MTNYFTPLNKCLCCENEGLFTFLDLKKQPLANNYHDKSVKQQDFELAVNVCDKCWHSQLTISVDPDIMFKHYLYVSGTTKTLLDYFDWFADKVTSDCNGSGSVLEIACNDGSQLDAFRRKNWKTKGVDPAENLLKLTKEKGLDVVCDYWGSPNLKLNDTYDAIVAQNVFAHVNNPFGFLTACKDVLKTNGRVYIQTSQANMITNGEFDTIYHEHISFFSAKSMRTLVERAGLFVQDIFNTPIHGTSYVFVVGHEDINRESVDVYLEKEAKEGRYKPETYGSYGVNANNTVSKLKEILDAYRSRGYCIAGYGAAAKGNVLLNFGNISLDYIVDDNPLKQNLFTPGSDIPICAPSRLKTEQKPLIVVPLSWNFFKEIKEKVINLRSGSQTTFVKYFPSMEIIGA